MNEFKEMEFAAICKRFNTDPVVREVTIEYSNDNYFRKIVDAVNSDRRGEVVFCVIRSNGKIITITCEEYPRGIFRIPTGGIGHKEDIIEAVHRETKEELGIGAEIIRFGGVVKIKFKHMADSVMFYSYIFLLRETGGRLLLDASDDEVSEVREVDLEELETVVEKLKNIPGEWNDWGRFRYITSAAVVDLLKKSL